MLTKSAADIRFQLSECSVLGVAPSLVSPQYAGTRPIAWNRGCTLNRMFSAPKFRSIFQVSTRSMVQSILGTHSHSCLLVTVTCESGPGPACDGLGQSVTRQSRDSSLDGRGALHITTRRHCLTSSDRTRLCAAGPAGPRLDGQPARLWGPAGPSRRPWQARSQARGVVLRVTEH